MARSYKVFFREKIIFLSSDKHAVLPDENSLFISHDSVDSLKFAVKSFQKDSVVSKLFVYAEDLEKLWNDFKSMFDIIEAAGGVVKNYKDEILFIFRNGKWDLPKGKIEKEEKVADASVREVGEECGVSGVQIIKEIISTYHIYFLESKNILKKTHWFEMKVDGSHELKPQKEEGISEAKWISKTMIPELMKNTYPSIKEVLSEAKF